MTEQMTGADLDQLDELSATFQHAGEEFTAKAATLRGHIGDAVGAFNHTLARLTRSTATLTDDMRTEIADVSSLADGVAWTGANRGGFDGDLATFRQAVVDGAGQINDSITELRTQIDSRFAPVMEEFGDSVQNATDLIGEDTAVMNEAVATQRSNLDQAANVGWTSA